MRPGATFHRYADGATFGEIPGIGFAFRTNADAVYIDSQFRGLRRLSDSSVLAAERPLLDSLSEYISECTQLRLCKDKAVGRVVRLNSTHFRYCREFQFVVKESSSGSKDLIVWSPLASHRHVFALTLVGPSYAYFKCKYLALVEGGPIGLSGVSDVSDYIAREYEYIELFRGGSVFDTMLPEFIMLPLILGLSVILRKSEPLDSLPEPYMEILDRALRALRNEAVSRGIDFASPCLIESVLPPFESQTGVEAPPDWISHSARLRESGGGFLARIRDVGISHVLIVDSADQAKATNHWDFDELHIVAVSDGVSEFTLVSQFLPASDSTSERSINFLFDSQLKRDSCVVFENSSVPADARSKKIVESVTEVMLCMRAHNRRVLEHRLYAKHSRLPATNVAADKETSRVVGLFADLRVRVELDPSTETVAILGSDGCRYLFSTAVALSNPVYGPLVQEVMDRFESSRINSSLSEVEKFDARTACRDAIEDIERALTICSERVRE